MGKNDILKRIEKLEKESHSPTDWGKRLDHIEDTISLLQSIVAEIINSYERQTRSS